MRKILFSLFAFLLFASQAQAALHIDISHGNNDPMPIAVTDFFSASAGAAATAATNISGVVAADLERSGLFRPIAKASFIQSPSELQAGPRYPDWRVLNAQALVAGKVTDAGGGQLRVEFRLYDIFSSQQIAGLAYTTTPENWRRIAHKIADVIYNRITGESGYFDTRIVYVAESGPQIKRVKRLAIMDQDGANHRFLTDGSDLVLTPRFNPAANEITFLSYRNDRPRVYLFNLETGQQRILGEFTGMTFAPRFAPDGRSMLFTLSKGANSNIYSMDLSSQRVQQLTNHPSISTGGSYSQDMRQITFESDRGGRQQIYVMDANGGNPHRISFGQGDYGTPVWSPRGDLIAFTKIRGGQFYVGVMRPDGSGERLIAQGSHPEGPTWAPNGRVLMFFESWGGRSQISTVDLTGMNQRKLITPLDGSDPAWSGLLN